MKKLILLATIVIAVIFMASCSQEKGMAILIIDLIDPQTDPFGDIKTTAGGIESDIVDIDFRSQLKNQGLSNTSYADIIIEKLVISYTRTDGGTDAPSSFEFFKTLRVAADGEATMENVPILSATKKLELPLSDLYYYGYERSTSYEKIQLRVNIEAVGKTVEGDPIYARGAISMEITNWADQ